MEVFTKDIELQEDGNVLIRAPVPSIGRLTRQDVMHGGVTVVFNDGRRITALQRRKAYALIGEIAEYMDGTRNESTIEDAKDIMKQQFVMDNIHAVQRKMFSLSDVDESTASQFIDFLVRFIIRHDIPTRVPLIEQCEDISQYIYACLVHKKCCICGRPADLHHMTGSKIGMGGNREQVHHLGRACLPLCREHHNEAHQDEDGLMRRYHLEPVKIDAKICKIYKLKK